MSNTSRLNLAAFRVPDGVREAIRHWLALLPDRSILVVAATIGQEFELRCLRRVTQVPNHQLLDALREAVGVGVLTPLSHGGYRFSHALIRNTLSEELNSADRAGVHLKIGEAVEELYQLDVEVYAAALAHHFREGGDIHKAIDYSIRAGEAACAVFAYEEAIAHWRAASELMPEGPEDRERRADLLERTAELLGLTESEGDRQFKHWRQALKLYKDLGRPVAAARVEARIAGWLMMRGRASDMSWALQRDQETESVFVSDREGWVSSMWRDIVTASAAALAGHTEESLAASGRAMGLSERVGDDVLWARAAISHASGLLASGQLAQSFSLIRQVSDEADRLNDNITGTGILAVCGYLLGWLCDPSEAVTRLERELNKPRMADASLLRGVLFGWLRVVALLSGKLPEASGLVSHAQVDPLFQGLIYYYQGEWERADAVLSQAADRARREDRHVPASASRYWLARVRRALGQHSAAAAILQQNLAFCIEAPQVVLELHSRAGLASVHAETQRPEQAHPHLARCRDIIAAGEDWRGLAGHVARAEAAVAAAEGRFDTANEQFANAVEIYRRYQVPFEEAEALHYWGRALLSAGDRGAAMEKLNAAMEIYQHHSVGGRWLETVQADKLRAQSAGTDDEGEPLAARVRELRDRPAGGSAGERAEDATAEGVFRKSGEYWTLSWAGSKLRLKDKKGLRYIAYLLHHAGHEIAAQELVSAMEPGSNGSLPTRASARGRNHEHTIARDLGDAGVALDATAKAQYKRRLEDLREELELAEQHNDLGQVAKTRYEIEFINDQVAASIGLHGRDRKSASHAERSRLAVTKSIRSALNSIRTADAELGRHLSLSIKTGYFCAYVPNSLVNWRL